MTTRVWPRIDAHAAAGQQGVPRGGCVFSLGTAEVVSGSRNRARAGCGASGCHFGFARDGDVVERRAHAGLPLRARGRRIERDDRKGGEGAVRDHGADSRDPHEKIERSSIRHGHSVVGVVVFDDAKDDCHYEEDARQARIGERHLDRSFTNAHLHRERAKQGADQAEAVEDVVHDGVVVRDGDAVARVYRRESESHARESRKEQD